jgi:hypothetical protein
MAFWEEHYREEEFTGLIFVFFFLFVQALCVGGFPSLCPHSFVGLSSRKVLLQRGPVLVVTLVQILAAVGPVGDHQAQGALEHECLRKGG